MTVVIGVDPHKASNTIAVLVDGDGASPAGDGAAFAQRAGRAVDSEAGLTATPVVTA